MGTYLDLTPQGTRLPPCRKSDFIATVAYAELGALPERIPNEPHVLICVVDNGYFEAALLADTQAERDCVAWSQAHGDNRPCRYFIMDKERALKMVGDQIH